MLTIYEVQNLFKFIDHTNMAHSRNISDSSASLDDDFELVIPNPETESLSNSLCSIDLPRISADDEESVAETVSSTADTDLSSAETVDVDEPLAEHAPFFRGYSRRHDFANDDSPASTPLQQSHAFAPRRPTGWKDSGRDSEMTIQASGSELKDNTKPQTAHHDRQKRPSRLGLLRTRKIKFAVITQLLGLLLAGFFYTGLSSSPSPQYELSVRRDALNAALHRSGAVYPALRSVQAADVLNYPNVTTVNSGTATQVMVFPTHVTVYVARPDQVFVTLPKQIYSRKGDQVYIGVTRGDHPLQEVARTQLIDGVFHLALKPADAYGFITIEILVQAKKPIRLVVKADLGSRLLQRATYENAPRVVHQHVQQGVLGVQHTVQYWAEQLYQTVARVQNLSADTTQRLDKAQKTLRSEWEPYIRNWQSWLKTETTSRSRDVKEKLEQLQGQFSDSSASLSKSTIRRVSHISKKLRAGLKGQVSLLSAKLSPEKVRFRTARRHAAGIFARLQGAAHKTVLPPPRLTVTKRISSVLSSLKMQAQAMWTGKPELGTPRSKKHDIKPMPKSLEKRESGVIAISELADKHLYKHKKRYGASKHDKKGSKKREGTRVR